MEITCAQMDVLLSFYIEGDLSKTLRKKVDEHLKQCSSCRAKYEIIKSMLQELKDSLESENEEEIQTTKKTNVTSQQYRVFQNNLSAYIDNELTPNENIKIKKYTINNKQARRELEDAYNIRKLMSDSFDKTKTMAKQDFSRNVIKQLGNNYDENSLSFHPVLKVAIAFIVTVLVLTALIIFSLTL